MGHPLDYYPSIPYEEIKVFPTISGFKQSAWVWSNKTLFHKVDEDAVCKSYSTSACHVFGFGLSLSALPAHLTIAQAHYCSCQRESSLGHICICRAHHQYSTWTWFYPLLYYSFDMVIKRLCWRPFVLLFLGKQPPFLKSCPPPSTACASPYSAPIPIVVLSQIIEPTATLNSNRKYNWLYRI